MALPANETKFDRRYSVKDFIAMPEYHERFELINGKLVEKPMPKYKHSWITRFINRQYDRFDPEEKLGELAAEVTFNARPDYAPTPDLAFWQTGRVPDFEAVIADVPDMAIEIQSPKQSMVVLTAKAKDYLTFGVRLVWLIQTEGKPCVKVFRLGQSKTETVGLDGVLNGEDVIPGFEIKVSELFRQASK